MANPPVGQTPLDFIRLAMLLIEALGSGEVPTADESSDALIMANLMLNTWNGDGFMIFTTRIDDFALSGAKQIYTLGAGGDFDMDRPAEISGASIVLLSNPAQPLEYPIPVYTTQDWQEKVPIKNSPGNIPLLVYDDGGFPLRTLTFWPFATDNTKFRCYSWQQLSKFADLTTLYSFPEAYAEAIVWNLAVRIAPMFGVPVSPIVAAMAISTLASVKSSNPDDTQLRSDLRGSCTASRMRSELFNIP